MAIPRALIATLFLYSLLVLHLVQAFQSNPSQLGSNTVTTTAAAGNAAVPGASIDCTAACGVRCSATKRPNLCKRACGSCCKECSCVPPGTSGNYEACPCYANKLTHGNVRKCP